MRILCVDIGNTFGKLIIYDTKTRSYSNFTRTKRIKQDVESIFRKSGEIQFVVVSSTVPVAYDQVESVANEFKVDTMKLNHKIIIKWLPKFTVAYDVNKLGSDRLIAAGGAFMFLTDNELNAKDDHHVEAVIVVDAGTAVNVEVIRLDKGYIGGSISPGFRLMKSALSRGTAQLPCAKDELEVPKPVGTCTLECIASGVYSAVCGGVYNIVSRICRNGPLKDICNVQVVFTGGDCDVLLGHLKLDIERNVPNVKSVTSQPLYVLKSMCNIALLPISKMASLLD